jgi:Flp pilus assembly protein TadD
MTAPVRQAALVAALLLVVAPAASADSSVEDSPLRFAKVEDLHFGEVIYFAYQQRWFDALQRLDAEIYQHHGVDEPELDSLYVHIDHAEFSVGAIELLYRMHLRAGRAVRAVLQANVEDAIHNRAAYLLARIHFQKGQPEDALQAIESIHGDVPDDIEDDIEFLRANVYMALGRAAEAVLVLSDIEGADGLEGFASYNLGIALLQDGHEVEALRQLDRAGQVNASDPEVLAIRDKSNLLLGTMLFEGAQFELAQQSLDRVRLEGAFSNPALLRAGWAGAQAERFDRALVPWGILAKRNPTDAAVQEALLALPYAYSKQGVHGRAALLYGHAVETFGDELDKVDSSIESIREGEFLEALVREEIRQSKDWVIRLRSLPDAPETFYLMQLMASHDFQTALQNYLDLEDLRKKLVSWEISFDAFEDIIEVRRAYYEPILSEIDQQFRTLDAQIRLRLEQRKAIDRRLKQMLIAPRPDLLATADEMALSASLEAVKAALGNASGAAADATRQRIRRLEGALIWSLETRYHERLTDIHQDLEVLNADVDAMQARYEGFVRTRQAATHSYVGYEDTIANLRSRVARALDELDVLMKRQGHMLETVATRELEIRRERLVAQQNQARFAFADAYDRAAKAQADADVPEPDAEPEAGDAQETPDEPLQAARVETDPEAE